MKKTQLLVLLRNIRATKVSFISITLFVALGIAMFLGVYWSQPALYNSIDAYYEAHKFHDFVVRFPYGMTDEDVAALNGLDEVLQVEGGYSADAVLRLGDERRTIVVQSLTTTMNLTTVIEGKLPSAPNELGIDQLLAGGMGVKVGDTISIPAPESGGKLRHTAFTVTAIVANPEYVCIMDTVPRGVTNIADGDLDFYALATEEAFDKRACGGYSHLYVRCDSLRGLNSFNDAYKAKAEDIAGKIASLQDKAWNVSRRDHNTSYVVAWVHGDTSQRLSYTLSLLIVFVSVMICYTAVSRLIYERRLLIGVQKSLGFKRREVTLMYMSYAIAAVMLGSILGCALAYFVIEALVNAITFESLFIVGKLTLHFSFAQLLLVSGIELALICLSSWLACHKQLSLRAVELLRGEDRSGARTRFYEKTNWWKRCSLYTQTTINNLMNDRIRVIATLVGVIGCIALIIVSMTVRNAVVQTPIRHMSEVCVYDRRLITDGATPDAMEAFSGALEESGVEYATVMHKKFLYQEADGSYTDVDIIVSADPGALDDFIRLTDDESGKQIALPDDGALMSGFFRRFHDVDVGDTLRMTDIEGRRRDIVIAGFSRHYIATTQIVMSAECYERAMGERAVENAFYINLNGVSETDLDAKLRDMPGYFELSDDRATWTSSYASYQESVVMMVYLSLGLSAVMALLVLLNLNVTIIDEKAKELIVMRINGFSIGAARKYIYRDNIVLTVIGTVLGAGVGVALGALVAYGMINTKTNFMLTPTPSACITGVCVSAVFSVITNLISLRRVGKLRVADLNK